MLARDKDVPGWAIGGLSGGEEKDVFWRVVGQCTARLPRDKPRYCMGVGYGEDLLVCAALGVDMADCVFPTRTAVRKRFASLFCLLAPLTGKNWDTQRFGVALTFDGPMHLSKREFAYDFAVIDSECTCPTCDRGNGMSRASLHALARRETAGAHAVTLHNLVYQVRAAAPSGCLQRLMCRQGDVDGAGKTSHLGRHVPRVPARLFPALLQAERRLPVRLSRCELASVFFP